MSIKTPIDTIPLIFTVKIGSLIAMSVDLQLLFSYLHLIFTDQIVYSA